MPTAIRVTIAVRVPRLWRRRQCHGVRGVVVEASRQGQFDVVAAGNLAYRINHDTGQTELVDGTSLVLVLPTAEGASGIKPKSQASYWPSSKIPQLGSLSIQARTVYREGKLQYLVGASPFKGALATAYSQSFGNASLAVRFYDADGFVLGDARLAVKGDGLRSVDERGEVQNMTWTGSIPMSREAYDQIASTDFSWAGFPNPPSAPASDAE